MYFIDNPKTTNRIRLSAEETECCISSLRMMEFNIQHVVNYEKQLFGLDHGEWARVALLQYCTASALATAARFIAACRLPLRIWKRYMNIRLSRQSDALSFPAAAGSLAEHYRLEWIIDSWFGFQIGWHENIIIIIWSQMRRKITIAADKKWIPAASFVQIKEAAVYLSKSLSSCTPIMTWFVIMLKTCVVCLESLTCHLN